MHKSSAARRVVSRGCCDVRFIGPCQEEAVHYWTSFMEVPVLEGRSQVPPLIAAVDNWSRVLCTVHHVLPMPRSEAQRQFVKIIPISYRSCRESLDVSPFYRTLSGCVENTGSLHSSYTFQDVDCSGKSLSIRIDAVKKLYRLNQDARRERSLECDVCAGSPAKAKSIAVVRASFSNTPVRHPDTYSFCRRPELQRCSK